MSSISGMTISCFAACYVIALAVEIARLLLRWRVPAIVPLALAAIGLLAHSLYLIGQAQSELAQRATAPLSSWYDFCLLAAWVLAAAYLGLMIRRPDNAIGVFLLPLVLGLIGLAAFFHDAAPFPARTALSVWRLVHGLTLLVGTTAVTLGFATGLMYLLQSYRLKHKLPPPRGFRLPSLEWLQKFNRESLFISTCLLAAGLVSGVALNLISKAGQGTVSWTDPVVLSSGVLFLWLTVVTIFESIYRPAREGNKVAYLTLANFVFLGLALYFVLFGSHATASVTTPPATRSVSEKPCCDSRLSPFEAAYFRLSYSKGAEPISPGQRPGLGVGDAIEALEGRNNAHAKSLSRPFRAMDAVLFRVPRALPWAGMSVPPGGERTCATSQLTLRVAIAAECRDEKHRSGGGAA
ncbi:MAG: cytochrome c biogenesis protein CcsA [Planctomycetota bacterium]|nr:cytochrome c biogenesis protein CcsA [Planctomycetota bacterium]